MDAAPAQQITPPHDAPATTRHFMQGPLPEIIGYVGAALVASAGLNFVAQSWEQWPLSVQLGVLGVAVVVLYAGAVTILGLAGWRAGLRDPARANRRRLVAVLFALAALLVGAIPAVILDSQGMLDANEGNPWLMLPAACALLAAAIGAWLAPGVVSTLAVAGTSGWLALTSLVWLSGSIDYGWIPLGAAALGAVWLAAAPRVLAAPVLSEALGMAWLLLFLGPNAVADLGATDPDIAADEVASVWVSRGLLVVLAVVALTLFARGASGAWAVGGVIAAILASLGFAGQTLGWVAALLVAGVVLLALSALLIALRRRNPGPVAPSHAVGGGDAADAEPVGEHLQGGSAQP